MGYKGNIHHSYSVGWALELNYHAQTPRETNPFWERFCPNSGTGESGFWFFSRTIVSRQCFLLKVGEEDEDLRDLAKFSFNRAIQSGRKDCQLVIILFVNKILGQHFFLLGWVWQNRPSHWSSQFSCVYFCKVQSVYVFPKIKIFLLFSCPEQLNRWPCHLPTEWLFDFDITEWT